MNKHQLGEKILRSAEIGKSLVSKTDDEIAELVIELIWADMELLTPQSEVISEVIRRLKGLDFNEEESE